MLWLVLEGLTVALAYYFTLLPFRSEISFSIYQTRDLDRATAVARGSPIFFGPETSGGGHLPGGLYYDLISIPARLGMSWQGTWNLLLLLTAFTVVALWIFVRKRCGRGGAILMFSSFIASYTVVRALVEFNNSSFVFPFIAAALLSLLCAFSTESKRQRNLWWPSFCLCAGLGLQIHLTVGLVLITGLFVQFLGPRIGLQRIELKTFGLGLLLVAITLTPYAIWKFAHAHGYGFGQEPLPYTGSHQGSPASLLRQMHIQFARFKHHNARLENAKDDIKTLLTHHLFPDFFQVASLVALLAGVLIWRKRPSSLSGILALYWVLAFLFMFPLVIANNFARYVNGSAIAYVFMLPLLYQAFATDERRRSFAGLGLLILLLIPLSTQVVQTDATVLVRAAWISLPLLFMALRERDWRRRPAVQWLWILPLPLYLSLQLADMPDRIRGNHKPTVNEYTRLVTAVHEQTGWDYANAKRRLYYINTNNQLEPRLIYQDLFPTAESVSKPTPDGYFTGLVIFYPIGNNVVSWLIDQGLEPSLERGLKDGAITVGPLQYLSSRYFLIPYYVHKPLDYPAFFSNHGDTYMQTHETLIDDSLKRAQAEPHQTAVAVFNSCDDNKRYCRVALTAESKDLRRPENEVKITALGYPIGFQLEWVAPDWTQSLSHPFVTFHCADKAVREELADSIGFRHKNGSWILNHSFIAPFERTVLPRCRGPISKIELGYESAQVITMFKHYRQSGASQAVAL
jgi:hypothetical protein